MGGIEVSRIARDAIEILRDFMGRGFTGRRKHGTSRDGTEISRDFTGRDFSGRKKHGTPAGRDVKTIYTVFIVK